MKKLKALILITITGIVILFSILYICFLFAVPKIISSPKAIAKIENIIFNKTQFELHLNDLEFKPCYNLSFNLKAKNIIAAKNNKNILNADDLILEFAPLKIMPEKVIVNQIYFDKTKLPASKKDKKSFPNIKSIPDIKINKANIIIQNDEFNYFKADLENIDVKNNVIKAQLNLERNVLKTSENKKFIDNFNELKATADISLKTQNKGLYGIARIKNLSAKNIQFSVPISFKDVDCLFDKDTITLKSYGLLGSEKVYTDLFITDLFNDKKVKGSVKATLTKDFVKTYIPDIHLDGKIKADVDYFIHNKKPIVEYKIELPKGTQIGYKPVDLGLIEKDKRLYVKTKKENNNLFIKNYDYSMVESGTVSNIITGEGLFVKQNGKMTLDYITCKTNGEAPVSIIGTLKRYIKGGTFAGDLKYSGTKKVLTGDFRLLNSNYKNFKIDEAKISANDKNMLVTAKGTFEHEPYFCLLDMVNKDSSNIIINDIQLYLKKYVIRRPETKNTKYPKKKFKISKKVADSLEEIDLTVKQGSIKLDELQYKNIFLNNIELIGNSENNVVNFKMPGTKFAKGTLSANGKYDINTHSSDINFSAEKIDSNLVADMFFGLENQIVGYANASMRVLTSNKLESVMAFANFAIEDGALTKIGSTEFMMKNKKYKIQDLTNFDIKKMEALRSTIIGSFNVDEHIIENAEIFTKHKYLSLYIKGNYDIREKDANLEVFGAYNKDAQKGIKILFVPLSIITKVVLRPEKSMEKFQNEINKIPVIYADNKQKEIFTVRIKGDLNENIENKKKINIQLKRLKK